MLARGLRGVLEALFPARCIGCTVRGTVLCLGCRGELPYLPAGVCARCAGA
ncbi:MAG: double zinc ribbon domain-containing protein, partial [Chloroflexota bacterium]